MDFIYNGQATGSLAALLTQNGFSVDPLRPFIGKDGRSYTTVNNNGNRLAVPTNNAIATLRKDDWLQVDQAVLAAARPRLRAFGDLVSAGLTYTITDGMGVMTLAYQTQSDATAATVSMSPRKQGAADRPEYDLRGLPLPIISKDFSFDVREIAASRRNGHQPLDTTQAELASMKVSEEVEKLTLGLSTFSHAGYSIEGYTNFQHRLTKSMRNPTSIGYTAAQTLEDVLAMKTQSQAAYHYGPWMLYTSAAWDTYLDNDYSSLNPGTTLRERLSKIDQIQGVRTLDHLTGYQMVLVQMTRSVVDTVIAMALTTFQWQSPDGFEQNFKVACIMVPRLRYDHAGNTGIVHGTSVTAVTTTTAGS